MPGCIVLGRRIGCLAATAASFLTYASPQLEHKYEFSGTENQESFVSFHRLNDNITTTIESKSTYRADSNRRQELSAEQKTEARYHIRAGDNLSFNPIVGVEGNEQKLKQFLALEAHHHVSANLGIRISYGYENQRISTEPSSLEQHRGIGKVELQYQLGRLNTSYNLTQKSIHASTYESEEHVIEHELNLQFALCSLLNPYLKLESLDPFFTDSDRELFVWLGIKRTWR